MDQIRKFGEQTFRILEFKPEGLEGYDFKSASYQLNKTELVDVGKD